MCTSLSRTSLSRPSLSRRRLLALLSTAAAVTLAAPLTACGGKRSGPEAVHWGKENCDYCGMIIDDPHYAAEIREGEHGKLWKFDDLGCAAMFLAKQPWADDARTEFWAGDSESGKWIDGKTAWYVTGAKTPMMYGFAALSAKREGAMTFTEYRQAVAAKGSTSRCEHPERST